MIRSATAKPRYTRRQKRCRRRSRSPRSSRRPSARRGQTGPLRPDRGRLAPPWSLALSTLWRLRAQARAPKPRPRPGGTRADARRAGQRATLRTRPPLGRQSSPRSRERRCMRPTSVSQLVPRVGVECRRRRQSAALRGGHNHASRRRPAQRSHSVVPTAPRASNVYRNARSRQTGTTTVACTLTEEQQSLRAMAHDFAAQKIRPVAWEYDRDGTWPQTIIEKAWEVGMRCVARRPSFLPEPIVKRRWHRLLHNGTARRPHRALRLRPGGMITTVPLHFPTSAVRPHAASIRGPRPAAP